jgi:iron complex outermembrane receptor protein
VTPEQNMQSPPRALTCALLLAALAHDQALGQDPTPPQQPPAEGDPLIVTARKVEERLEDVPGSVSSIDGRSIERSGARSVREATERVPNLLFTEFSSRRLSFPFIRGIGSGVGDPAVVTYVDGVPQLSSGSSNLPPLDLDRIEVLRGPQGTLYGRNALGGVLHLHSERPAAEPEAEFSGTFGTARQQDLRAHFSGPINSDGIGATLSLLSSQRDGYTRNSFTGNEVDSRDALFGRAQVFFRPTDDSELRVSIHAESADDGGFVLAPLEGLRDDPFTIDQDFEGTVEREILAPALHYQHFGDGFDVTSITAFTDWDVEETSDFDFTSIDGVRRSTTEDQSYFYQEVRLNSAEEEGLRWLVGASGFLADSGRAASNEFRPGGAGIFFPPQQVGTDTNDGSFDDLGLAAFGSLTVPLADSFELTGGLRYDREDKEADVDHTFMSGGVTFVDENRSFDEDFDEISPSASVLWKATEDTNVYASAARGFKAGGFNLTAPNDEFFFEPETSWSYELGVKHALTDAVDVRFAVFLIDWEDMQLSLFDQTAGGYVANAGESTSQGIELEVDARIADGWSAYATAGLLDTEFDEFTDSFGMDDSGNDLPFAPEHMFAVGVQHTRTIGKGLSLDATVEAQRTGDFYYDPSNLESESMTLVAASLGVRADRWRLALFGRNLLDEEYVPVAFQANPADPTFFVGENAAPRTFGVTLGLSF